MPANFVSRWRKGSHLDSSYPLPVSQLCSSPCSFPLQQRQWPKPPNCTTMSTTFCLSNQKLSYWLHCRPSAVLATTSTRIPRSMLSIMKDEMIIKTSRSQIESKNRTTNKHSLQLSEILTRKLGSKQWRHRAWWALRLNGLGADSLKIFNP